MSDFSTPAQLRALGAEMARATTPPRAPAPAPQISESGLAGLGRRAGAHIPGPAHAAPSPDARPQTRIADLDPA